MNTTAITLGYSPKSAVDRQIKDGSRFDSLFPKPDNKKTLLKKSGEVEDTVEFMKRYIRDYHNQTAKIAQQIAVFEGGKLNDKKSVDALWHFVVDYIKYNLEQGEQLRTPARVWYDAQVMARQHPENSAYSADCDCMAVFCGCILYNWGIPFSFRITGYTDVLGICHGYQHVYVLAHCKGETIPCDPVYHLPNREKPYEIQKTFFVSSGGDIALAGLPEEDDNTIVYVEK